MVKKLFAMMLVLVMAVSCCAFAEEDVALISAPVADKAKVAFDVSAPDAEGFFTVNITLYNATYKGIIAGFSYDPAVIAPVNAQTKEVATDVMDVLVTPTVAKDLETGEEIADWQSFKGSKMQDGTVALMTILNTKAKHPNTIVSDKFQALADENGLLLAQMTFKKLTDAPVEFKLVENKTIAGGMMVINSYGMQDCTVEFNYAEGVGENTTTDIEGVNDTLSSDKTAGSEMETRVKLRAENVVFLGINNYATVANGTLKWVDKTNKNVKPYIKNDRTMIPLRYIAEELKWKVDYKEDTREILIENGRTKLVFQIDSLTYTNDGLKKSIDVAPEIVEDRTFVPLRAVSEALNCDVQWLEGPRMVVVAPANYPWAAENEVEKKLLPEIQLMMSPLVRDLAYVNEQ